MICLYISTRFLKIFEQPAFVLPEVLGLIRQAAVNEVLRSLSFYKGTIIKHPRFKPANTRILIDEIIELLIDNADSLTTRFTGKSIRDFITDSWRWWRFQRVEDEIRIITNRI